MKRLHLAMWTRIGTMNLRLEREIVQNNVRTEFSRIQLRRTRFMESWRRRGWQVVLVALIWTGAGQAQELVESKPRYEFRQDHDPDGTGKFYLGREIAHVMSHRGAAWLERPEREEEEKPELLIESLELEEGAVVADIGAGTGYFTRRLAERVGKEGVVYAVDIQPEMLERLEERMEELGIENVKPVLSTEEDTKLPEGSVDLVLMVDVYHEFSHPYEMMQSICQALKPQGKVVFVEYRAEDPSVPIKPLHKMTEAQVRKESAVHPLTWTKTVSVLPRQHLIIFERNSESLRPSP